jgi:hypothetical protein
MGTKLDFDYGVVEDAVILLAAWVDELERTDYGKWPQPLGAHLEAIEALIGIAKQVLAAVLDDETVSDDNESA